MKKKICKIGTLLRLAWSNLKFFRIRTLVLMFLITFTCITVVASVLLTDSYNREFVRVREMLGADIILAPDQNEGDLENSLFTGSPSTVNFDSSVVETVCNKKYVNEYTDELFIASLSASCCEYLLQIIAIDYESNKIIKSFINKSPDNLNDYYVIVGSNISYSVGDRLRLYGYDFYVAAKMEATGMGYDNSVFINEDMGRLLCKTQENESMPISMRLIRVDSDYGVENAYYDLNENLRGTGINAYKTSSMYGNVSKKIGKLTIVFRGMLAAICIILGVSVIAIIIINNSSRGTETVAYDIAGISQSERRFVYVAELLIIDGISCMTGVLTGYVLLKLFLEYIKEKLDMVLVVSFVDILKIGCFVGVISLMVTAISAILSELRLSPNNYKVLKA